RIVYISKSTVAPVSEAVSNIARKSLSRNMQLGITGFLYFDEKIFLQELEGVRSDVEWLYAKIEADPRHSDVRTILRQDAETRVFGEWSMAFFDGKASDNELRRRFSAEALDELSEVDGPEILRLLREISVSYDPSKAIARSA
ncbi:MAG: BLUF domain-containing protein, partial [Pseudomonadota bacterium]